MPEAEPELDETEAVALARRIEAGEDGIEVPAELVEEREEQKAPLPQSLYAQILGMTIGQKIKLAIRGNGDARNILIRDTNKMIRRFVLQNPRITEEEILMLAKDRNVDEEILRLIADSREWTKVYAVRQALVENAKTPSGKALQLLPSLGEREISRLAKSKQVPSVIAVQARRILFRNVQGR